MSSSDEAEPNDVDLALRHVAHRFPEELARALLPGVRDLRSCTWSDTQVTSRERRMDKNLSVIADGVARLEHLEWQLRWTRTLLYRMYEYHSLQTMALRDAAKPGAVVPLVRSTVVLLGGRKQTPWPQYKRFRTTPRSEAFSGLRVRVEAVYQRTLAELASREAPFWMIFAPLAVDATESTMPEVVKALKKRTTRAGFEELAVAMTVLADADSRQRGLRSVITSQLPEELVMQSWVYKQGELKGHTEGRTEGRTEGLTEGYARGLREAIAQTLEARGLGVPDSLRVSLEGEARVEVLRAWLTRAITAERADDVCDARSD